MFNQRGLIMPNGPIHFIHQHDKTNPHNGASIAYWVVYPINYSTEGCMYEYSVAVCGKKDNFSRKIGRNVAAGRLLSGKKTYMISVPIVEHNAVELILNHYHGRF